MSAPILKYFRYDHLPFDLQKISMPLSAIAESMDKVLPDGAEKSAGLRKLLEAKDCLVRAAIDLREKEEHKEQTVGTL